MVTPLQTPPGLRMLRLKSFGTIDLRGDGGDLRGVLTQPKRLALLLRLAAERPGTFQRRDTLLAMFWPELDTSGARNALRQALFHLRRELGEGVLINRGDEEIGLDPARISADAADFEEAAAAGRWRAALDLLQGELAPGLYVSDAPGFEEWLEGRRADIHRRAASGAWALCREAEEAGAPAVAAGWARRAVDHAPDDEAGVRRLLRLLIESGDAAGAAQAYSAFEERMRREYGVAPAPETTAIRHGIPAEPVVPAKPAHGSRRASDGLPTPQAVGPATPAPPPSRSWRWGAAAGACLLIVAALLGWWRARVPADTPTSTRLLLISPFRTTTQDTLLSALSAGLVDLISARLSGAALPRPVDPDVALRAVDDARAGADGPGSAQLLEAARRTGAGFILSGTLLSEGGRLVLAPVVIATASGASTPLPQVTGPIDSLPWMVDRMAASLLSAFAGEGADAPALASIPLPALRAYLDGREAMRNGRVADAMASLAHAVELDSTFALAALDYAEAVDWAGEDPNGAAKSRAWALRDRLGIRDRAILVALAGRRYPGLTPAREQVEDWDAAIRLAPDRSRTWFGLGDVLFHMGAVARIAGAEDRARNAFDRALALDSASIPALLHRIELAAREGDTAVVRRLMPLAESRDSPGDALEFLRWRAAVALGDESTRRRIESGLDSLSSFALLRIMGWGQLDGLGMAAPAGALAALQRRTGTFPEFRFVFSTGAALAGNRGQFHALLQIARTYTTRDAPTSALFYASGAAARGLLDTLAADVAAGRDTTLVSRSELLFWRLWEGSPVTAADVREYVAVQDRNPGDLGAAVAACLAATRAGLPDAASRLRNADSLADLLPSADQIGASLLILARCHEAAGDRRGALATLARRALDPVYGPGYLAGVLYDEGRLALQEGDGARALRAWRHLLVLRDDPDPALRPQVAELQRVVDSLARN
ncbi:MAG TPA: bacterial transcriptional activator domain-containing protein [Gemmatimonadales bacterium]|nr:bacterial transcriptional activator domain-containing protein [Gemmatimonadales bacterium]